MKKTNLKTLVLTAAFLFLLSGTLKAQWLELNTGVGYDLKSLSIPTPDVVWASGQDGKVIKSVDGGFTWTDVSLPVPGGGQHTSWNIFALDQNTAIASTIEWGNYTAHLFRTSNGGLNWTEVLSQAGTMFNNVWIYPDNTAFLVGDQLGDQYWVAYKSTNGGATWSALTIPCGADEYGYNNSLFVRNGVTYFAGTTWDFNTWTVLKAQVYKSYNLTDWQVFDAGAGVQPPNLTSPNSLWFNDANKGYVNGAYTVNGGKKWLALPRPDPSSSILTLVGYEQRLWAITSDPSNLNVYYTNCRGNRWALVYSPSIPGAVNNQLTGSRVFNTDIVLYLIRNNGTIAKYVEPIDQDNPSVNNPAGSLIQNYPNPFNPITEIQYQIPANGFVSLKIYDMLGRETATLVNEVKTAGTYSIQWNASSLSSGIYFYRLETGNFVETRKMMLVK